jgi:Rps23 Pro-64 3,4-dihydroxylase Tpa1-like proline 4-hydroxylase
MSEQKMKGIQELVQQLDLIQHIAQAGYWLSTEEVCNLLSFDQMMIPVLKEKELNFSFIWRNYVVTFISQQGNSQCWQLQDQNSLSQQSLSQHTITQSNRQNDQAHRDHSQRELTQSIKKDSEAQIHLPSPIFPSTCIQIEDFLSPKVWQEIYNYALLRQKDFIPTTTSTEASDYRRSLFLPYFPEYFDFMVEKVRSVMPEVRQHLNLDLFEIENIEAQLTAHNHGNFYKIHNDNGSENTANRELTYVYYFYRQPKPFSGGELVVYDSKVENNFYVAAETKQTIQPLNNSIVFFLSRYMHEVLPVSCPTESFADSRFTVNGWVRKANSK